MILVLALCFLIASLLPWAAVRLLRRDRGRDLFAPLGVLTALHLLAMPYLLLLAADRSYLSHETNVSPWVQDLEGTMAAYVLVASLGFLAMALGLLSPLGPALARPLPVLRVERFTPRRTWTAVVLTGALGALAYLWFLSQIGGLANLWKALYTRTAVAAGMGYVSMAYTLLLTVSALLLTYSLRFRMTWTRRALVVLGILAVAVVLASMGGRSGAVTLILFAMMTAHYGIRRFRRLVTPWTVALGAVLFVFILVMPLFRTSTAHARYAGNPGLVAQDALRNVARLAPQLTAVDRGMVIVGYFSRFDRLWWGASYVDLLSAPIPRTLLPDKPPVDEGVYLTAIMAGNQVRPSMPARQLPVTAQPMGHWIMYMNFGLPGYLAGMLLGGAVIGAAYRYMHRCGYSPFGVYLYAYIVLGGFSWSNLVLVSFAITVTLATLVFWLLFADKGLGRWFGPERAAVRATLEPRPA
ncbi:MAG TPA: O-antigen polymerase [Longimicrobium sp.]|nr:O-antigen polymerase [Longimicrobium sp.]